MVCSGFGAAGRSGAAGCSGTSGLTCGIGVTGAVGPVGAVGCLGTSGTPLARSAVGATGDSGTPLAWSAVSTTGGSGATGMAGRHATAGAVAASAGWCRTGVGEVTWTGATDVSGLAAGNRCGPVRCLISSRSAISAPDGCSYSWSTAKPRQPCAYGGYPQRAQPIGMGGTSSKQRQR
ncbi:hypothetical protein [Streptosporangium carneum]|uniref:hypothetical protein n=1 Tax=Streptosporangium carneum TaxID=47481 RepID=UPI0022F2ACF5|nr:hypothetical protein [Streptosporangium carneum]